MKPIGEQSDRARAFCKAVVEDQEEGKDNRKLMTVEDFMRVLDITTIKYIPEMMRSEFYKYNVYTRKLRGRDLIAIWWQKEPAHGRGVKKNYDRSM